MINAICDGKNLSLKSRNASRIKVLVLKEVAVTVPITINHIN